MARGAVDNFLANIGRKSWFHSLDPRTKVAVMVFFGLTPLLFTDPRFILFFILLSLPLWLTANLDFRPMRGPMLAVGIMLFVVFFFNLLRVPSEVEFDTGAATSWTLSLGPLYLTSFSVLRALFLCGRLLVPLTIGLLIIATTDPTYLAKGMKKMGVPTAIVFMFLAALRFVPIIMEQLMNLEDALSIRGVSGSRLKRTQLLILPLFITSLRRTRTMGLASEAKAFGADRWNVFYEDFSLARDDKIMILMMVLVFLSAIVARFGFGLGAGLYIPTGSR